MPFGMMSGVSRRMAVLDGVVIVKGTVLGVNLRRPIVISGDGDALFPNYFGEETEQRGVPNTAERHGTTPSITWSRQPPTLYANLLTSL